MQPATELAVAGSVLQRLTCSGWADRRAPGLARLACQMQSAGQAHDDRVMTLSLAKVAAAAGGSRGGAWKS